MGREKSTRALVIGSRGNIGVPLVNHLSAVGYEVLEVDIRPAWRPRYLVGDINRIADLLPAFDWNPDVVFMLAGAVGREVCEQAAAITVETNLAGLNNVLQLCRRAGSRLVFFSSSEVYGSQPGVMDEAASPPRPNNRYALSKWLGEQLVEYEVCYAGLQAIVLRPFTIYDENEEPGDHRSAMIRFAWHLANGRPIQVHEGSARGWLHISDAVRCIEAAGRLSEHAVINIGHPDVTLTTDLAEMIRQEVGAPEHLIQRVPLPGQMTSVKFPALQRQAELLGVLPRMGLAEGIHRVCARQMTALATP